MIRNFTVCDTVCSDDFHLHTEIRVEESLSFTSTGVQSKCVGLNQRSVHKVYIALFTCTNTRAVHLDLVPALNAVLYKTSAEFFFYQKSSKSAVCLGQREDVQKPRCQFALNVGDA